jgi:uncharacterized protein YbjT (DUF2867 family)
VRIVIIGGTGRIGSLLVRLLTEQGHQAIPASPRLGINAITGEGLAPALDGASVVVDVTDSPNFTYATALAFFERSTHNLLAAERVARIGHHVALSVVGTDELWQHGDPTTTSAGYFRAKQTQEELIAASGIPYSIVRATQFFEFIKVIANLLTVGETVRVPAVLFQPVAATDVASGVGRVAADEPVNRIVEIGGPEQFRFEEPMRRVLAAANDPREVVTDPAVGYYGITVTERTLVPGDGARLGETRLDDWLRSGAGAARRSHNSPSRRGGCPGSD